MSFQHTSSLSLYAIPAAWILAVLPHTYGATMLRNASGGRFTNINPRQNGERLAGKVPASIYNRFLRAEAAHANALEQFPLFASAVIAMNMAGLPAEDINMMSATYLGLRALYAVVYINTEKNAPFSWVRSAVWVGTVGLQVWAFVKAGKAWGATA